MMMWDEGTELSDGLPATPDILFSKWPNLQKGHPRVVRRGTPLRQSSQPKIQVKGQKKERI